MLLGAFPAAQTSGPLDVSALTVGPPTTIAEIDVGKLKGSPQRLAWAPGGDSFELRTADGDKPTDQVHFYTVTVAGGGVVAIEREPEWAAAYWAFKSDRFAPGLPSLIIDLQQGSENLKVGTGGGVGSDRTANLGTDAGPSAGMIEKTAESQKERVFRLTLLGETIGEWVNATPVPGQTFSWGPKGSGAIAFVDADGRLFLFDQQKHKRAIAGVKDATLPAWTTDGSALAFLRKTGRRKYALTSVATTR
jgi:ribosomal protein L24E